MGVCRTNALESLVIAGFVRGLSVRDVEATLAEALGQEAALSKSTVSRICHAIKVEFDAWGGPAISPASTSTTCISTAATSSSTRASGPSRCWWPGGSPPTASRCSSASPRGRPSPSTPGPTSSRGLLARGLTPPLLVVSDGAPGLIGACEQVLARSLRQRCLIHRARNVLAKVPKSAQGELKSEYWKLFDEIAADPGQGAVDEVRRRIEAFVTRYEKHYPAATKCLTADVESLTVYLRFPKEHWPRIRHSNFIERTFGETRRRVKVIGRLPGERSCLSLVWAVLDRASKGWRGVQHTPSTTRQLAELRRQILEPPVPITTGKKRKEAAPDADTAVA